MLTVIRQEGGGGVRIESSAWKWLHRNKKLLRFILSGTGLSVSKKKRVVPIKNTSSSNLIFFYLFSKNYKVPVLHLPQKALTTYKLWWGEAHPILSRPIPSRPIPSHPFPAAASPWCRSPA